MSRFSQFRWVIAMLCCLLLLCGCGTKSAPTATQTPQAAPSQVSAITSPTPTDANRLVGFSSYQKWQDHFQKHGTEFGNITADQYLEMAQQLRDRQITQDILEIERKDHVTSRFERSSGNFLAFNRNRTIRTFFKPKDGERYFRRQAKKDHD